MVGGGCAIVVVAAAEVGDGDLGEVAIGEHVGDLGVVGEVVGKVVGEVADEAVDEAGRVVEDWEDAVLEPGWVERRLAGEIPSGQVSEPEVSAEGKEAAAKVENKSEKPCPAPASRPDAEQAATPSSDEPPAPVEDSNSTHLKVASAPTEETPFLEATPAPSPYSSAG